MRTICFFLLGWGWVFLLGNTVTPPPVQPITMTWPEADAVVQGQVVIQGRTAVPNFQKALLDFQPLPPTSPAATPLPKGWILLATLTEPVVQGPLATWETQNLPEGPYLLRLRVFLRTGDVLEHRVRVWIGERPNEIPRTPVVEVTQTLEGTRVSPTTPVPQGTPTPKPWPVAVEPWLPTPSSPRGGNPATWRQAFWLGVSLGVGLVIFYWWAHKRKA